ncbi:hypothetical protein Bca4012_027894 [Brassica carinata]
MLTDNNVSKTMNPVELMIQSRPWAFVLVLWLVLDMILTRLKLVILIAVSALKGEGVLKRFLKATKRQSTIRTIWLNFLSLVMKFSAMMMEVPDLLIDGVVARLST